MNLSNLIKNRNIPLDLKIILNSDWFIRSDIKRNVLYNHSPGDKLKDYMFINSIEAIIITLFDGINTLSEVLKKCEELFEINADKIKMKVYDILVKFENTFSISNNNSRLFDKLEDFVIPSNELDLDSVRFYKPMILNLHISTKCIRNCIYCVTDTQYKSEQLPLSTQEIFELLGQAKEMGIIQCFIGGGEPFIRKDIPQIIKKMLELEIFPIVSTKAFIDKNTAKSLRLAGLLDIQYSIDSSDKETADLLTGSEGFFNDAIDSITNLRNEGIHVNTNTILTKINISQVESLINMLDKLDVGYIRLSTFKPSSFISKNQELLIPLRELSRIESRIKRAQLKYPNRKVSFDFNYNYDPCFLSDNAKEKIFNGNGGCYSGAYLITVLEDGNLIICTDCPFTEDQIIGNIRNNSLKELWYSEEGYQKFFPASREKFKDTVCHSCEEFDNCINQHGRCYRNSYMAYGRFYGPDPYCPKAPKGNRIL